MCASANFLRHLNVSPRHTFLVPKFIVRFLAPVDRREQSSFMYKYFPGNSIVPISQNPALPEFFGLLPCGCSEKLQNAHWLSVLEKSTKYFPGKILVHAEAKIFDSARHEFLRRFCEKHSTHDKGI